MVLSTAAEQADNGMGKGGIPPWLWASTPYSFKFVPSVWVVILRRR